MQYCRVIRGYVYVYLYYIYTPLFVDFVCCYDSYIYQVQLYEEQITLNDYTVLE